jgi:hypothetical protein
MNLHLQKNASVGSSAGGSTQYASKYTMMNSGLSLNSSMNMNKKVDSVTNINKINTNTNSISNKKIWSGRGIY